MAELSFSEVSALIKYDAESGRFWMKRRSAEMFPSSRAANTWNSRYAGKEVCLSGSQGYRCVRLIRKAYRAHRLAWLLSHGSWPDFEVDHVNGDRSDNRLINLRPVTHAENAKNRRLRQDNKIGVTGVYWFKPNSKWVAKIQKDGRLKHLGYFDSLEEACSRRREAEIEFGYHENHGKALGETEAAENHSAKWPVAARAHRK